MPAVVFAAPYNDRSARVICEECGIDTSRPRTAEAQDLAADHNRKMHPKEPDA